jgi:hypothetical protein
LQEAVVRIEKDSWVILNDSNFFLLGFEFVFFGSVPTKSRRGFFFWKFWFVKYQAKVLQEGIAQTGFEMGWREWEMELIQMVASNQSE